MMQNSSKRPNGRLNDQVRPLKISYNSFGYATSSVLFEVGDTKVLCSVSMQQGVPSFLKGSGSGWLNAEYAMLPTATTVRTQRESTTNKKNGRAVEISRLIGRALRSVVDLSALGERTITIDCDVLQADGGTRTACISASYVALEHAVAQWVASKQLPRSILTDAIASISAGVSQGVVILDPDFAEDSTIDSDFNFVVTKSGALIEVQGTAEKHPVSWDQFDQLKAVALKGAADLFSFFAQNSAPEVVIKPQTSKIESMPQKNSPSHNNQNKAQKSSMFSLANRLQATQVE
jgi:ribonuclease PH